MSDEQPIMVCLRVEGADPRSVIDGSIIQWCNLCGTEVWLSPSGQAVIERLGAGVHCWDCATGAAATSESVHLAFTHEQVEELAREGVSISEVKPLADELFNRDVDRHRD